MNLRFLITAGPTREFIDPVRYISNRSSGKMGYALASAAAEVSASVTLVTGPVSLPVPDRVTAVPVTTADEMAAAVYDRFDRADIIIMAAAVCDFRPREQSEQKIKKEAFDGRLELDRTEDILAELGTRKRPGQVLVGFALETADLVDNARRKLQAKRADLLIANRAGAMEADDNQVTVLNAAGGVEQWPAMSKLQVAERLIERILQLAS